ncbi:MAG: hypothetical protein WDM96_13480 [Lacunisphaera sp.]
MTEDEVNLILGSALFIGVRPERFPARTPLRGVLKNDARIPRFLPGEIIVRQGDYGHSAFVILEGKVRISCASPTTCRPAARNPCARRCGAASSAGGTVRPIRSR